MRMPAHRLQRWRLPRVTAAAFVPTPTPTPTPTPASSLPITKLTIEGDSQSIDDPITWAYHYKASRPDKDITLVAQRSRQIGSQGTADANTLAFQQANDAALGGDIFAMIGSNDFSSQSVATFMANLQAWAQFHRSAGRRIILATPPPYTAAYNPSDPTAWQTANARIAEYRALIRADWRNIVDALADFGSHPWLHDPATLPQMVSPVDGLHLENYDALDPDKGQNIAYLTFKAVLDSAMDATRIGSTAPYPGAWFGPAAQVAPSTLVERLYIVSGLGLGVSVAASAITPGALIRRGDGAFGTDVADVMNGDCITLRYPASANPDTTTPVTVQIGSGQVTLEIPTAPANQQAADYVHGGILTQAAPTFAAVQDWGNLAFEAGTGVLAVACSGALPAGVTLSGVAATFRFRRPAAYGARGFDVYTCPIAAAGTKQVIVNYDGAWTPRQILSYGTITHGSAAPIAMGHLLPTADGDPHLIPATDELAVPLGGIALAFAFCETGEASVLLPQDARHVAEGHADYQSSRSNFAVAKLTGNDQAGYNIGWVPLAQGWIVWGAA